MTRVIGRKVLFFYIFILLFLSGCIGGTPARWAAVSGSVRIDSGAPQPDFSTLGLMSMPRGHGNLLRHFDGDTDQFLVQVRPGTSSRRVEHIARQFGFVYLRSSGDDFHVIKRMATSIDEAKALLGSVTEVVDVEWNAPLDPLGWGDEVVPDDEYFTAGHQWGLDHVRAITGGRSSYRPAMKRLSQSALRRMTKGLPIIPAEEWI